jgi:hypothetical protein
MDRKEFDYKTNLELEIKQFELLAKNKKDITLEAIKKNLKIRKELSSLKELAVHYGNLHKQISSSDGNKHEWKAYVTLSKSDGGVRSVVNKLVEKMGKCIENNFGIKFEGLSDSKSDKIDLKDADVIKKVLFKLHPTFRQPNIYVEKAPFELSRIGWGTFGVGIVIEFQDNLKMDKLELEHNLSFSRDKTEDIKLIYVDAEKALKNRSVKNV